MATNLVGSEELQNGLITSFFIERLVQQNILFGLNGRQLDASRPYVEVHVEGTLGETKEVTYQEMVETPTGGGTSPAFPAVSTRQPENTMRRFETVAITFKEALFNLLPIQNIYDYDKYARDLDNMAKTLASGTIRAGLDRFKPSATGDLNDDRVVFTSGAREDFTKFGATNGRLLPTFNDFRALADLFDNQGIPQSGDTPANGRVVLLPRYLYNRLSTIDEINRYDVSGISGSYNTLRYTRIHDFFVIPIDTDFGYLKTGAVGSTTLSAYETQHTVAPSGADRNNFSFAGLAYYVPAFGYDVTIPRFLDTIDPLKLGRTVNGWLNHMVGNLYINPSNFVLAHQNAS